MSVEEFPLYVPMGEDRLCAVLAAPEGEMHDLGVVLLTGGNYTRVHRNRMWVRVARALAERGFPSIRVDYHGVGDSTGRARFDMEIPFDSDALAAADFLQRATGVTRLVMLATCFGGRNAVVAAAKHPDAVAATVFPMPVLVPRDRGPLPLRSRVRRWLKGRTLGRKLLRRPSIRRIRTRAHAHRDQPAMIVSPKLKEALKAFLPRGTVRFVYGELSDSLVEIRHCLDEVLPRLAEAERRNVRLDVVEGADLHRFQSLEEQDIVVDRAVGSVLDTFRSLEARAPHPAGRPA
ncbi:MAG: alpha/beta fold hydrolase [Actinobacteria bacterium]|nr:alpha/beta fold hydrolase [Actinomycetota bacterium]